MSASLARALWLIPSASFAEEMLTDEELATAVAEGRAVETSVGGLNFIDGQGENIPPMVAVLEPIPGETMKGTLSLSGGPPDAEDLLVTIFWGDGTQEQLEGSGDQMVTHTYDRPGKFIIQAINSYGQRASAIATAPYIPQPVVTEIIPNAAAIGSPPGTIIINGDGFIPESQVYFNGGLEPAGAYVSPTQMTVGVDPRTASGPWTVPVQVRNDDKISSPDITFTFTELAEAPEPDPEPPPEPEPEEGV